MDALEALGIAGAGLVAGTINTVVGSGTLITFPVLLAFGYPPVTANVSNTLGLVPGSVAGAFGYRRELAGQGPRLRRLVPATVLGGIAGAVLLLTLPPGAFARIVPALIGLALVLVIIQPWLARRLAARGRDRPEHGGPLLWIGILLTGVYGGYFGAAQGVLLLAVMGILLSDPVQRLNAAKNVFGAVANLVSGIVFVFAAHVAWLVVLLIAVGSTAGGLIGARIGRKLPPIALRVIIVAVGVVAIVRLLVP
ncbi:MAG TPA: sulfite exporter TauE/SafE family protein [Pseudonocardiaceae bacterium]